MRSRPRIPQRFFLIGRAILLLLSALTYLRDPDDVMWRFIKGLPNPRMWEHLGFATAAAALALSLYLKAANQTRSRQARSRQTRFQSPTRPSPRLRTLLADVLQAAGIGSLLPLAGFVALLAGNFVLSLLALNYGSKSFQATPAALRPNEFFIEHAALCCACISMLIFSIVLIDHVADVLFAATAIVFLFTSFRPRSTS